MASIQKIVLNCQELTELNMGDCLKDPDAIDIFCQYISPKLQKINIGGNQVKDHHIRTFVNRCPKITHLYLHATPITDASVPVIVQGLYKTLVKLQLPYYINFPALTALRYLPNLKYFWYRYVLRQAYIKYFSIKL